MDRFDVVFRGEFLLGQDIDEAKEKLAGLFKLEDQKLDALFAGYPLACIGRVAQARDHFYVAAHGRALVDLPVKALKKAWQKPFGELI